MVTKPKEIINELTKDKSALIFAPAGASSYFVASKIAKLVNEKITVLGPVDFYEVGVILARTEPGSNEVFQFFRSFPQIVWLLIFVSIFMNSLFNSITTSSPRKLFAYFWNYFELLFSSPMQILLVETNCKFILGIWILSCYYFAIGFTSFMMDYMIRSVPLNKIDILNDLAYRDQMTVYTRFGSPFAGYIQSVENKITNSIKSRLKTFNKFDEIIDNLAIGLLNGTASLSASRTNMFFRINQIQQSMRYLKNEQEQFSNIMHISEQSIGFQPNFLLFNSKTNQKILNKFSKM